MKNWKAVVPYSAVLLAAACGGAPRDKQAAVETTSVTTHVTTHVTTFAEGVATVTASAAGFDATLTRKDSGEVLAQVTWSKGDATVRSAFVRGSGGTVDGVLHIDGASLAPSSVSGLVLSLYVQGHDAEVKARSADLPAGPLPTGETALGIEHRTDVTTCTPWSWCGYVSYTTWASCPDGSEVPMACSDLVCEIVFADCSTAQQDYGGSCYMAPQASCPSGGGGAGGGGGDDDDEEDFDLKVTTHGQAVTGVSAGSAPLVTHH